MSSFTCRLLSHIPLISLLALLITSLLFSLDVFGPSCRFKTEFIHLLLVFCGFLNEDLTFINWLGRRLDCSRGIDGCRHWIFAYWSLWSFTSNFGWEAVSHPVHCTDVEGIVRIVLCSIKSETIFLNSLSIESKTGQVEFTSAAYLVPS